MTDRRPNVVDDEARMHIRSLLLLAKEALELGGEHDRSVAGLIDGCITLLEPEVAEFESELVESVFSSPLARTH